MSLIIVFFRHSYGFLAFEVVFFRNGSVFSTAIYTFIIVDVVSV